MSSALTNLRLPTPQTIAARATLSANGFDASVQLQFGDRDRGAKLFAQNTPGGASAYVNTLGLEFQLGASSGTVTVSGSALVTIPKLCQDGQASQVEVTLGGSLEVSAEGAVSVSIQFDITGLSGPWTDAFGIKGLSVGEVAGKIGVKVSAESAGIPVPTLAFKVDQLQLPKDWNDAIGVQDGASTSSNLQWVWNGGHNQQWYVLPTDSGYAELVNRNSGKCLAAPGYGAGQQLIQTACTGNPGPQWFLNVYPGQSLLGQTKSISNRATGLDADVSGASTTAGAAIDQWYYNGNGNQQWYFGPAVG